jgi:hypothetical protein
MSLILWSACAFYVVVTTWIVGAFWYLGSRSWVWALAGAALYAAMPVMLLAVLWS